MSGGGGGTFYPGGGTVSPSAECPGGHCALVQNVRGDIPHRGTIHPPTPARVIKSLEIWFVTLQVTLLDCSFVNFMSSVTEIRVQCSKLRARFRARFARPAQSRGGDYITGANQTGKRART